MIGGSSRGLGEMGFDFVIFRYRNRYSHDTITIQKISNEYSLFFVKEEIKLDKQEIARRIYNASYVTGEFMLRSGKRSHEYFDKYLFESDPSLLVEISKIMKHLIPAETEIIAGLEMGGIPIVTALSIESGVQSAFVRKTAKEYGTCKLAEGADVRDKNVCVIEDVVSTGGQIIESVKELRKRGAKIDTVLCVILRDEKAVEILADENLKIIPAFTMDYIKEKI